MQQNLKATLQFMCIVAIKAFKYDEGEERMRWIDDADQIGRESDSRKESYISESICNNNSGKWR